jgi:fatty acid-binding protein DegV
MRIGFVVDASCDLPDAHLEANGISILPSILELGGRTWLDERAPDKTMMFYRRFIADRAVEARSGACSAEEIREIFLRELVLEYERVLVISPCADSATCSRAPPRPPMRSCRATASAVSKARCGGSFALRVLDSGSLCAGQAITVCRGLQLLGEGRLGFEKMRRALREEVPLITCLLVPGDPWYLRRRGLDGRGKG